MDHIANVLFDVTIDNVLQSSKWLDLIIIFLVGFDNCEQRISVPKISKYWTNCLPYRASWGDPSDLKIYSNLKYPDLTNYLTQS